MHVLSHSFLDKKLLLGFGILGIICTVNTKVAILPISSLTFLLISIITWFLSLCITLFFLHKLLQKNEPLQLKLFAKYSFPKLKNEVKPKPEKIHALVNDIDKYFISKWYGSISKDKDFPEECKHLLEETIKRLAEVQLCVNNKLLLHAVLNSYLKHLKEFRRSLKRREKYGCTIDELYRYSHVCSSGSKKAKDFFLHNLTVNLLIRFINSELWNSLPCTILVSILSRKFTSYLLNLISKPEVLNFIFLNLVASKAVREKYNLSEYSRISITQYYDATDHTKELKASNEKNLNVEETVTSGQAITETDGGTVKINEVLKEKDQNIILNTEKSDVKTKNSEQVIELIAESKGPSAVKPIVSDPVKIYEAKHTKSNKTWKDSKDLGLGISLGQDPLDALPVTVESIKTVGKSTFWDTGKIEHFVEDSPLLNEMKHTTQTTMEGLKSSIKPISDATVHTLHNIKDLQESTMNNALHKIGDFQDEAAGMVEGILDFGRAGLRKGLRLTGLQENIENAKASLGGTQLKSQTKKKPLKLIRTESPEKAATIEEDSIDSVWMNPLQADSPNFDGQILLEKSRKSVEKEEKDFQIPFISMEQSQSGSNSPDPEYEDTADLASSIAKLRCLLQQRSSESSMSTPALSPMPPDEFGAKVAEVEIASDVDETDGVMPSFYKFCAKTATGVLDKTLNTIKTALPGQMQGVEPADNAWIFIQTEQNEADILTRMKKLLSERKEYCKLDTEIDTAYEAIDSLDAFPYLNNSSNVEFEDELDDFEVKLPITKAVLDILCELLADTNSPLIQEPVIKALLLTLGNTLEKVILEVVDKHMQDFCINLITIPEQSDQKTLNLDMDLYVEAIMSSMSDTAKLIFGKTTICQALQLFVSAMQFHNINQDVVLQIFELVSLKLMEENNQMSPPASA